MNKVVRQYRYFSPGSDKNYPSNISKDNLQSGRIFFGEEGLRSIVQLGIQTLPGTKFYLNNSVAPTIVGYTGIYELKLNADVAINALSFDGSSLNLIGNDSTHPEGYLIVDAIYEVEE